jgi:L-ascorbate metabolism protein UlaG (beta-lactamase superfamily)
MPVITSLLLALVLNAEVPMSVDHIHWLGHSSFRLDDGAVRIYIDPWKLASAAPKADVVLITHAHFDHFSLDDIAKIAKPETVFVAPADVAARLRGRTVVVAAPGGAYQAGPVKVTAVAAYNIGKDFHPKTNGWVGYIVTLSSGQRIYHSGDSDFTPEMKAVKTDVALIPCGGTYTMTAAEAAEAANVFEPTVLIPMHWGDIVGARADADTVAKAFTGKTVILRAER